MSTDLLSAGRAALARGAWEEARTHFEEALLQQETPEACEELGQAAWWLNEVATALEMRERAYRLYQDGGDRRSAARMACHLSIDYAELRGDYAVADGWLQRAKRLLQGLETSHEHGWIMVLEGHDALLGARDTALAKKLGAEAMTLGRGLGDIDVEMQGLGLQGLAKVSEGEVAEGMRLLDEATAIATAGESRDLFAIGTTCCYLISACERVRDYDRAAQWCERVKEFCRRWRYGFLFATCRMQHASILIWRGDWVEAEAELTAVNRESVHDRPGLVNACTVRLAELRRRQGRWEAAANLFAQAESHPLSLLGRGALVLDQGDAATAADLAERFLRRIPLNDRAERVPGLELLARAQITLGKSAAAKTALAELQATAALAPTEPFRAAAKFVEGLGAASANELETARQCCEDALDLYERSNTPFEMGRARLELARVLYLLGRGERAETETRTALAVFQKIGAAKEAERAEALQREISAARGGAEQISRAANPDDLTQREIEVLRLIADGKGNDEIAKKLFLSTRTVERHISNLYLKIGVSGKTARAAATAYAIRHGMVSAPLAQRK